MFKGQQRGTSEPQDWAAGIVDEHHELLSGLMCTALLSLCHLADGQTVCLSHASAPPSARQWRLSQRCRSAPSSRRPQGSSPGILWLCLWRAARTQEPALALSAREPTLSLTMLCTFISPDNHWGRNLKSILPAKRPFEASLSSLCHFRAQLVRSALKH